MTQEINREKRKANTESIFPQIKRHATVAPAPAPSLSTSTSTSTSTTATTTTTSSVDGGRIRYLLLLGAAQHGKSELGNLLVAGERRTPAHRTFRVGDGNVPCSKEVQTAEVKHTLPHATDVAVTTQIIDTPGLLDSDLKEEEVLQQLISYFDKRGVAAIDGVCVVVRHGVPLKEQFYRVLQVYQSAFPLILKRNSFIIMTAFPLSQEKLQIHRDKGLDPNRSFYDTIHEMEQRLGRVTMSFMVDLSFEAEVLQDYNAQAAIQRCRQTILNSLSRDDVEPFSLDHIFKLERWREADAKEAAITRKQLEETQSDIKAREKQQTSYRSRQASCRQSVSRLSTELTEVDKLIKTLSNGEHLLVDEAHTSSWNWFSESSLTFRYSQVAYNISSRSVIGEGHLNETEVTNRSYIGTITSLLPRESLNIRIRIYCLNKDYHSLQLNELNSKRLLLQKDVTSLHTEETNLTTNLLTTETYLHDNLLLLTHLEQRLRDLETDVITLAAAKIRLGMINNSS